MMQPSSCKSCEGTSSELRRRVLGNGAVQIVYQCLTCGRSASNPLAKAAVPNHARLPAWDESLAGQYDQLQANLREEQRTEWFEEHDAYLRTDKWRLKRAAVLRRANGVCEGCGERPAAQVHHLTYEHWQDEFLWELVAICIDCHERAHEKRRPVVIGVRG